MDQERHVLGTLFMVALFACAIFYLANLSGPPEKALRPGVAWQLKPSLSIQNSKSSESTESLPRVVNPSTEAEVKSEDPSWE